MTLYALVFCAGFLTGPMRCSPQPGPDRQTLKECRKAAARHQRAVGAAEVRLPNGLIAVRRWRCEETAPAQDPPTGGLLTRGGPGR